MQAASNIGASAKAGMDKTKAVVQEKAEKMKTRDPLQKQIAKEKKEVKIHEAEQMKMQARAQNEAAKHGGCLGGLTHGTTTGTTGTGHTSARHTGIGGLLGKVTGHTGAHDHHTTSV